MSWGGEDEGGRWEYLTVGPYRFPHERDTACNRLCASNAGWHMHSSDVHRQTGEYFAVMTRWVRAGEDA